MRSRKPCFARSLCVQAALSLAFFALTASPLLAGPQDKRLDIYWIDVEGGAATLIVTPAGETVLIDTGNPGRRDPDRIVRAVTNEAGLRQIDHLIITHYHRDHFGGAPILSMLLPIKTLYDNGVFDGMPDDPGKAYFEFPCEKRVVIQPGDRLPLRQSKEGLTPVMQCLGARKQYISPPGDAKENKLETPHKPKDRDFSDNANSVVMRLEFGPFRFFDAGDLTWNQEARLVLPVDLVGEVDVYQVTHHGLDTSNNPVILETLKPRVAIMNNGATKGCMPEVFANLKECKSLEAMFQVHKNERPDGSVNNVPDEFIANRGGECQGNLIKLSVASDGKSYTVSIPAHDVERTYQTKRQ